MDQTLKDLREYILGAMPRLDLKAEVARGELTITVAPGRLLALMGALRDDGQLMCKMLVDVCGVDYPEREKRFEVVYHLLSLKYNQRVRVKVPAAEGEAVPSLCGLFSAAAWFERETWDLYGIYFSDHPDLRRILTDYGFEGHPLRKDFPLTGFVEPRYDDERKRVIYEPVKLTQEFRRFDFLSPWEGTQYELASEDKADTGGRTS